jgi:hypothetical protein
MSSTPPTRPVLLLVAVHLLLLAAYTFPQALVPEGLRLAGQWYARPFFHQYWRLFAPDPPTCSCTLEVRFGDAPWSTLDRGPDTYLQRRTMQTLARHVQAGVQRGDNTPEPRLRQVMRTQAWHALEPGRGHHLAPPEFRLVERCILDPRRPHERTERMTELRMP